MRFMVWLLLLFPLRFDFNNKKSFRLLQFRRDESLNFRGTTLIGIFKMPAPGISACATRESRLSGNGEETRFRLNFRLSGNTRGPVTSSRSALPRTGRQLSGASRKDFFPVIVSVRFAVEH